MHGIAKSFIFKAKSIPEEQYEMADTGDIQRLGAVILRLCAATDMLQKRSSAARETIEACKKVVEEQETAAGGNIEVTGKTSQ